MPAPKGNQNAIGHGFRGYLTTGRLPSGCSYVRRQLNKLRQQLQKTIGDNEGEITLSKAALIQSIIRHECRAQLLSRWLRVGEPELHLRMQILTDISAATTARDKVLDALKLDKTETGPHIPSLPPLETSEAN